MSDLSSPAPAIPPTEHCKWKMVRCVLFTQTVAWFFNGTRPTLNDNKNPHLCDSFPVVRRAKKNQLGEFCVSREFSRKTHILEFTSCIAYCVADNVMIYVLFRKTFFDFCLFCLCACVCKFNYRYALPCFKSCRSLYVLQKRHAKPRLLHKQSFGEEKRHRVKKWKCI